MPMAPIISTQTPFYKCVCGYDSRNITLVINNDGTGLYNDVPDDGTGALK